MLVRTFRNRPASNVSLAGLESILMSALGAITFEFASHSGPALRTIVSAALRDLGWSNAVRISPNYRLTITSMREDTALTLQTGNAGRSYADLLKLQYLFVEGKCRQSIYILPSKIRARQMGENLANFERVTSELRLFEYIITVPMLVVGLE